MRVCIWQAGRRGELGLPVVDAALQRCAWDCHVTRLQVQQLIVDLQRAEERCVVVEAEVREEVAEEMAQV